MAVHAPITGAPLRAPAFKLNGVSFMADEPYPYLEQAHALACCLDEAAAKDISMNREILQTAARGIATLIHLARIGLEEMDSKREGR